jgi:hypothetical protein
VEVIGWLLPGLGAEGEDVAGGVLADAHEDVVQVLEGIDAVQLARNRPAKDALTRPESRERGRRAWT